jgi:hypothetical protein
MAETGDIPFIMDFLDRYWERGCLLSRDRAYFEYEFLVDGRVNFIVARHKTTGTIDAVTGFIQCSKNKNYDAFGVLWVTKPKSGTKFLGLVLGDNIPLITGIRVYAGVGLKPDTGAPVSEAFYNSPIRKMDHYYRLSQKSEFTIAEINKIRREEGSPPSKKLIPVPTVKHLISWIDFASLQSVSPMFKDLWYIEHRYYNHPYYKFCVWGIEEAPGKFTGLLIGRIIRQGGSGCLRIVDYLGENGALDGIGDEIDLIMDKCGLEYTDFYCYGIPGENMRNAGFVLRDETDTNIIPNHFEPFERKNTEILTEVHGFLADADGARLFKGDGDQGRPRRLRTPEEFI